MPAALKAERAKHVMAKPRCARGKVFWCFFFKKELLSSRFPYYPLRNGHGFVMLLRAPPRSWLFWD
jgi:hypothetical protein